MASIFTKIIDGQIPGNFVWADDQCVAFADINPHTDGHVLVVPRQEVSSYLEASDELLAHLTVVAKRIGQAQVKAFDAPRSGLHQGTPGGAARKDRGCHGQAARGFA